MNTLEIKIPLSDLHLTPAAHEYAEHALASNWISGSGEYVRRFETLVRTYVGRQFAVATANGTLALECALRALKVKDREIILPAFSFVAPAAAAYANGATLRFVDIDAHTLCISPLRALKAKTERTAAIIAVNTFGAMPDYPELAQAHIPIIEDAAESHGSFRDGLPAGANGLISVFSFHANKTISCGEGGLILTDDEYLSTRLRGIVNHGMLSGVPYQHELVGSNFRMTNLTAALAFGQAMSWFDFVKRRNEVRTLYKTYLPSHLTLMPEFTRDMIPATWLVVVKAADVQARDSVLKRLRGAGIDARATFPVIPSLQPYFDPDWRAKYPNAADAADRLLFLPTFHAITEEQVRYICDYLS